MSTSLDLEDGSSDSEDFLDMIPDSDPCANETIKRDDGSKGKDPAGSLVEIEIRSSAQVAELLEKSMDMLNNGEVGQALNPNEILNLITQSDTNSAPQQTATSKIMNALEQLKMTRKFKEVMAITAEDPDWYSQLCFFLRNPAGVPDQAPEDVERWVKVLKVRWMCEAMGIPDYQLAEASMERVENVYQGMFTQSRQKYYAQEMAEGMASKCAIM